MPPSATVEEAAITIFVEPGGAPVATATETAARTAEPPAERQLGDAVPPPEPMEPQAAPDFRPPIPPPDLRDAVPPTEPVEAVAPDFHQRPPPKPDPRPEPRKPPPPTQKAEPKPAAPPAVPRAAGTATQPSPAPSAAPSANSGNAGQAALSTGQPSSATATAPAPGWNALLAAWLAAHRRYPEEARRRSVEGDVTVRFSVAADGRVTDVAVVTGSGSSTLDAAAMTMLQGAALPPPGIQSTRTVRIRYRLAD